LSLVFSRRKPFQGGISMPKILVPRVLPQKVCISLIKAGVFFIEYSPGSGNLIKVFYGFSITFKISGLPGNKNWSSGKKLNGQVRYNKVVRGDDEFQEAFLEALRAIGSRGGKIKLARKIPDRFSTLVKAALKKYKSENK
jgi:hypothetical protein